MVKKYVKWENRDYPLIQNNNATLPSGLITPALSSGGNDFRQNFSSEDFIRLLSSIEAGSEMLYPDMKHYLADIFLCGLLCPPTFPNETGDCLTFTPYAPFVEFYPVSPYDEPNTIPSGFLNPPFTVHDGSGSLPNYYNSGDVLAFLDSIPLGDWTQSGWGLAGFRIDVYGSGQVEVDLLAVNNGGHVMIGIDSPPNYANVLAGIFGLNEDIADVGLDSSSVPPETEHVIKQEINIDKPAGVKTEIYFTFLPVVDDQAIPIRYGGGIASNGIQLCGFEQGLIPMGITDVRIFNGQLQAFENGLWTGKGFVIEDCNDVETCLSSSAIISAMQQNISDNIINISENTGDIATNTQSIANIVTVNNNQQAQINSNIVAIGDNTNDIADHETRITTLENATGGNGGEFDTKVFLMKEVIDTQSWQNDVATIDFENISQNYDYLELHFFGKSNQTNDQLLSLWFNDDTTTANYQFSADGANAGGNRIGHVGAHNTGYSELPSPNIISIQNYTDDTWKVARGAYNWNSGSSVSSGRTSDYGLVWESNNPITKISLSPAFGSFLAGGYALLIGVSRQEVAVPTGNQELLFDFSTDDYGELWIASSGTQYNNARYENTGLIYNDARIQFATMNSFNLVGIELEYFISPNDINTPFVNWSDLGANGNQDGSPNIGSVSTKVWAMDVSIDDLRIIVSNNNTTGTVAGYAQILSIKLIINGSIPSELQPYT